MCLAEQNLQRLKIVWNSTLKLVRLTHFKAIRLGFEHFSEPQTVLREGQR